MSWKIGRAPKTDMGPAFDSLESENKADEFDASYADPQGYAARNFPGTNPAAEAWAATRAQQVADQRARREQP